MKILNVNITNKVAVYSQRGGAIVCDNKNHYQIKFTFDAEWSGHSTKTARFVYNGGFYDVSFTGDTVTVPELRNVTSLSVGVYAGDLSTTTPAVIPCALSILSLTDTPSEDSDRDFANEAKEAAERAEEEADRAEAAAETAAADAVQSFAALSAEQMLGGIVQTSGDSETQAMSQKATTDLAKMITDCIDEVHSYGTCTNQSVYIGLDGAPKGNSNYGATGYISVNKNSTIKGTNILGGATISTVAFYDKNKTFISGVSSSGTYHDIDVTPPENAKYVRLCFSYTKPNDQIRVVTWSRAITEDDRVAIEEATATLATELVQEGVEPFNKALFGSETVLVKNALDPNASDVTNGQYMDANASWKTDSAWNESGYIAVTGSRMYCYLTNTKVYSNGLSAIMYDANKNMIGKTSGTDGYYPMLENAVYVRVPFKEERRNATLIFFTDDTDTFETPESGFDYVSYGETIFSIENKGIVGEVEDIKQAIRGVNLTQNQWVGKKWYAYGTSLTSTAQGKYVPYVADFSGMNVVNKGIPGGALVANRQIYDALMSTTDGKAEADLITIEVGANDASAPLGEVTSMDTTTFCGALNTCLKNVLTNCPKAQVVLMPSTRGRYNGSGQPYDLDLETSGGYTMVERDEAIRQVAEANGIYFIPFGSGLGLGIFRMQSSGLYNVDNIHHTELGGYNLAQGVWSYLKNIPLWYNSIPAN